MNNIGLALAVLSAATAALLSGAGSAIGVGIVGRAAAGVVSVDPSKFSKALVLQLLPGTQGLYGLLTAVLLLNRVGIIGGEITTLTFSQGLMFLAGGLPMGIVGLLSAIAQGRSAAAGIGIIAKKPDQSGKAIIMAAMVETYAILALLISILTIYNIAV